MKYLITLILLLGGCQSYWLHDPSVAREVKLIQYVPEPCGKPCLFGCYSPALQAIQINSTVPLYMQADALSHELKHAEGFRHEKGWPFNGRIHRGDEY